MDFQQLDTMETSSLVEHLKSYLRPLYPAILGVDVRHVIDKIDSPESEIVLSTFCEQNAMALYVERIQRDESEDVISFNLQMEESPHVMCSIIFIKCNEGPLSRDLPMSSQLTIMSSPGAGTKNSLLLMLENQTRHSFVPQVRAAVHMSQIAQDNKELENLSTIERKLRELDLAFDQCKMTTLVPHITIVVPPMLQNISTNSIDLRRYLEKSDATQIDNLFRELHLTDIMGNSPEAKEDFINEINNKYARFWPTEIAKQTALVDFPFPASTAKEIEFWRDFDNKVNNTKLQLESPGVMLTKLFLKRNNRVSEHNIREAEGDLDKCIATVHGAYSFLKDFPIENLFAVNDIHPSLTTAAENCLIHFSKLKHVKRGYNIDRASKLMDVLCHEVLNKLIQLLKEKKIMRSSIEEYHTLKSEYNIFFTQWNDEFTTVRDSFNDISKRNNIKFNDIKNTLNILQERLSAITEFRENHQKLVDILSDILSDDDTIITELQELYKAFIPPNLDVLDITNDGRLLFQKAKATYEKKLEKLENSITRLLGEKLTNAKSTDEKFRLFSIFNPLLFRHNIGVAVNPFRMSLIKNVYEDVERLQQKFLLKYDDSYEKELADLRDIPPLSGRLLWARQIENQLNVLLKRMENVIGARWEDQPDAKKLREICDQLFNILNVNKMVDDWKTAVTAVTRDVANNDLTVIVVKSNPETMKYYLSVNFEPKLVHLFKEIRHLKWLVPDSILKSLEGPAEQAFLRYPAASAIESALNAFKRAKKNLRKNMSMLLVSYEQQVREHVQVALVGSKTVGSKLYKKRMNWDGDGLSEWVERFSRLVNQFEGKVEDALEKCKYVDDLLSKLSTCAYEHSVIHDILASIQIVVNDMNMRGFSNINNWVSVLDENIENILISKLSNGVALWIRAFENDGTIKETSDANDNANNSLKVSSNDSSDFSLDQTIHHILLSNQILYISPPVEQACAEWISNFYQHIAVCTRYERISSSKFNVFASGNNTNTLKDYSNILNRIDSKNLKRALSLIQEKTHDARIYAQQWLQYQVLWDVTITNVADRVGRDISQWHSLLQGVKEARSTIDSVSEEKLFGPIVVNFKQVQNKVNTKYDSWQKELQLRFAAIAQEEIKLLHAELIQLRRQLEAVELHGSTKDVIMGVEFVIKMKAVVAAKAVIVQELEASEKLLLKQRHQFSKDWLYVSNLSSSYGDLVQIMQKQSKAMDSQLSTLQIKIRDEDAELSARMDQFTKDWERESPADGKIAPTYALQTLAMFSAQVDKLKEDLTRLLGAKAALGMDIHDDDRIDFIRQEVNDLRDVWQSVIPAWDKVQVLRGWTFKSIVVTKLRKELDNITAEMNSLPVKVRRYAQFEHLQQTIAKYMSYQPVLRDMTSEALKERHWRVLAKLMNLSVSINDLKLGHIWDINILASRKAISDQLSIAQGELALEQYIKEVKDYWTTMQLVFVIRENTRLISEWNVLFTMLEDHLNSLVSLKQSPYFMNVAEFQEDTNTWESKLTHLRGIFEIWVEVQRKWVYLSGIFRNPDIRAQLPTQFTKFKGVDGEFTRLMKRISLKPQIQEILSIDGVLGQLERQDTTMTVIQKALGEYLEKQRQIFPRFYFVNNDDLVEIIGNSNEPGKIFTHLSKMFAAITTLQLSNETTTNADGVAIAKAEKIFSKEGELVTLTSPVDLSIGVKDWLGCLEKEMILTLATLLQRAVTTLPSDNSKLLDWVNQFPAQIVILASQVEWTNGTQNALSKTENKTAMLDTLALFESKLKLLSQSVLENVDPALRKKCEQLITEVVHQRDVTRLLIASNVSNKNDFGWEYHLRYYWNPKENDLMKRLEIKMSNASFFYGFEYLGISERLVQTSLTDRCYLTLTQALHLRMGGNPFGPAGTGKTESVKMLGSQLGRFVLVFNCDENFDYAAMGRIFAGLCQVGAWGCFDEFNRLEERILSAVSQQILTIQRGLMNKQEKIELLGMPCKLHSDVGIFVTMNPGYAGRSNLPDNLKQMFRAVAMVVPDRKMIAQVMLFSQGITTAEELAGKIVLLFTLCEEQLSQQSHYDFGLRALKSVLTGAGDLKRQALSTVLDNASEMGEIEKAVLITSTCNSVVPKLVADDIPLFTSLLQAVFPGTNLPSVDDKLLFAAITEICAEEHLECESLWIEKVLQLKQVLELRHGVIMAGPSGTGKSTAWRVLLKALTKVEGIKGDFYVIDPKSIKKDKLYGVLDPTTLEWTDGVFTKLLRKITEADSLRSGAPRRSWIIFDGDVDPEWAENLNSVLDDNKILTLPSGDRLKLPQNMRIMMEVDTLKHATLATVSRCGMVWFADNTVTVDMQFRKLLNTLKFDNVQLLDNSFGGVSSNMQKETQLKFVETLAPHFAAKVGIVDIGLSFALSQPHIMDVKVGRLLTSLQGLLGRGLALAIDYNESNSDLPMSEDQIEQFASKWLLFSVLWAFGASMTMDKRLALGDLLVKNCNYPLPNSKSKLIDLYVDVNTGKWLEWSTMVSDMEIESHQVTSTDVVVTTTDTLRHVEVLRAWLASHKPFVLCGPPGSGKTMTLTSVIDSMPEYVLASLNFSSGTTPELILKTFNQYCEVIDSPDGLVMQPTRQSYSEDKWLAIFCDEINLPEQDKYGTQRVIMFMRQLTEQGGFWNKDCKWVHLRRIQFVGACNPPTDAGRVSLSERFMRHAPLMLVDYPAVDSLTQIYRCFNRGLLKLHPNLRGAVDTLTDAMVDFYTRNREKFTPEVAPQYIYSPRELSRWVRALYEAMEPLEAMTMEELVRLWGHEALRLFQDRLISDREKDWCSSQLDAVASRHFASINTEECLMRPLLYSNWLSKTYQSVKKEDLKNFVAARLKVFYEEELDVPLVIFDDVLEHILRIDNVLRHPMGHLLLVGESGVGKTVMSRFVSWMNGLSVFQIKANNRYTVENFDEDLRGLLKRVGVDGEKVCFIFDESNALSSAFLERMNALLASGEVPGLFEGEDLAHLLTSLQSSLVQRDGAGSDTTDELWRKFTRQVQRNLHVIFTMNPASTDFENRCKTSPALFNRCVVDWYGTWSQVALAQVGCEFTEFIDTTYTQFKAPVHDTEVLAMIKECIQSKNPGLHESIVASLVSMHNSVRALTIKQGKSSGRQHYISPRDYLDLIRKFVTTEQEKRTNLEEQQTHIRTGLNKLLETETQVTALSHEMVTKGNILRAKDAEANMKLSQMVEKQNEAEQRKAIAEELTVKLMQQNEEIRVRREAVESELSQAEPALISAKQCVQNIRKPQLDEVRALPKPPAAVQSTMEIVATMMGEKSTDWSELRKVIRRDDFISTVVNFDPMTLTPKLIKKVQEYLNNPELDYNSVERASKACGPLYQWASSQIHYATILRKIAPLREEVESLQIQSDSLLQQKDSAVNQVEELEGAIKQYKVDYATAIRATETIRTEMDIVTKKVARAEALLNSLSEEKERWKTTSASFDMQMSTLIGDCLLASAFLTYAGIFDHRSRQSLMFEWNDTLQTLGVPFRENLELTGYLSTPSQQLLWKGYGLPTDELAVQNCILLERFYRYPMVIDPSGQATSFFLRKYADQKIIQTSFLDASFLKTLASAVRFGTPLLVQDVENLDPVLNPVLNKEFQKTGGRTLIRIGTDDIDFSPKFMIILTTRNPFARFAPDLCSRVTMVNFTVTPASLEAQVLSKILHSERPDVDRRRTEIFRLQSEQSAKLRELEDELLNKISAVQGAILDDDSLVNTLEVIKAEAAQLNKEVLSTEVVLGEVKLISNIYESLATAISTIYFSLERLSDVSFLYQFSLQFFLSVVQRVLEENGSKGGEGSSVDAKTRLSILSRAFYTEISRRVLRGLRYEDKIMFVARLAQISTMNQTAKQLTDAEEDFLLRGVSPPIPHNQEHMLEKWKFCIDGQVMSDSIARNLLSLSQLSAFSQLYSSMTSSSEQKSLWAVAFAAEEIEKLLPVDWILSVTSRERASLLRLAVIRIIRPDRVIPAMEQYVSAVLGDDFDWRSYASVNLRDIVERDSICSVPVMLCSESGQDASSKVDALASNLGKNLLQVAMGSAEGYADADKSIAQACKTGAWVLLRNVHLCPEWLGYLEKKIHGITPHSDFRLFLTCEINPAIPTSLLRASDVVVAEASTGIKANLQRFFSGISPQRINRSPVERSHLYVLLGWLNAVVHERLRYAPLGWTKKYEFNDADTACAIDCIDEWVDSVSGKKSHVSPDYIPWEALKKIISQSLYGGRIDNEFDQAVLDSFIDSIFRSQNYGASVAIAVDHAYGSNGMPLLTLPDSFGSEAFDTWIKSLPDKNSPTWLGLPATAENQLQQLMGQRVISRLPIVQGTQEEIEQSGSGDAQALLKSIMDTVSNWLTVTLPKETDLSKVDIDRSCDVTATPLQRCLAREIQKGAYALNMVRRDLSLVCAYCKGDIKGTNDIRKLISSFSKGLIPSQWKNIYVITPDMTIGTWINDLAERCSVFSTYGNLSQGVLSKISSFWLGGMFTPEAFITATRQTTAQINQWSLEELELYLDIGESTIEGCHDTIVANLVLESAQWTAQDGLELSSSLRCRLPASRLRWRRRCDRPSADFITFPIYLNETRIHLIVEVLINLPANTPKHVWAQRGVALIMQMT